MPALGTRQVNIVLVDTSTRRYTTDPGELAAIKNKWADEAVKSSNYYGEVSYGAFGLSTAVFGPVQLPGAWEDYFDPVEHPQGFRCLAPGQQFLSSLRNGRRRPHRLQLGTEFGLRLTVRRRRAVRLAIRPPRHGVHGGRRYEHRRRVDAVQLGGGGRQADSRDSEP